MCKDHELTYLNLNHVSKKYYLFIVVIEHKVIWPWQSYFTCFSFLSSCKYTEYL